MPDQWVLHDGPPARLMKQTVLHQGDLARDVMPFDAGVCERARYMPEEYRILGIPS